MLPDTSNIFAHHLPTRGAARAYQARKLLVEQNITTHLIAVLPNSREALDFLTDCEGLEAAEKDKNNNAINFFYLPELPLVEDENERSALMVHRHSIFSGWLARGGILIASAAGVVMPVSGSGGDIKLVQNTQNITRAQLIAWLEANNFHRAELVWLPGQYAARGSIVDLYPASSFCGLRAVFDDDTLSSLRTFDPATQRSTEAVSVFNVKSFKAQKQTYLLDEIKKDEKKLKNDINETKGAFLMLFEPLECEYAALNAIWLLEHIVKNIDDKEEYNEDKEGEKGGHSDAWNALLSYFSAMRITEKKAGSGDDLKLKPLPAFKGDMTAINAFAHEKIKNGYEIIFCGNTPFYADWAQKCGFTPFDGVITEGFSDEAKKAIYLSEIDITHSTKGRRSNPFTPPSENLSEIPPQSYVIHEDYGVSLFLGYEKILTADGEGDFLNLLFSDNKRLLMPAYQGYKLLPHQEAPLDSLRKSRRKKNKEEAHENARKMAKDLLAAQGKRELAHGHAFLCSPSEMKQLTDTFPYKETEGQLSAWRRVGEDMERAVPMDRLIAGDVGFGKTEIAIRAAFKAALCGYQTAVITPTTLLCEQHAQTFMSRFSPFAVRAESLSRFKTLKQQREIVDDLREGKIDVIIGTHRLLSKDIAFKNLGLLIIDEEHRFGVRHKEKYKKEHPGIDILQLSATPIPRTLQLALSGLRDISVLTTAPAKRRPVITVVSPWSDDLIKGAVRREKAKGGQIFWVHNRVFSMERQLLRIKKLLPEMRIDVAHGQMPERELERVMEKFTSRKTDILLCTSIIESGLDIEGANTIIIDDAHTMGLAQLYQLRGRVGRREEQAYAFFLYPEGSVTRVSLERLEAVAELDNLGAGFSLARKDLDIRGGGDILGTAQHGKEIKITESEYFRLLEEEIMRLKGEYKHIPIIDWKIPVSIPAAYIEEDSLRMGLYRSLHRAQTQGDIMSLREELKDRFGYIPKELELLIAGAQVRIAGIDIIDTAEIRREEIFIKFLKSFKSFNPPEKLPNGWIRTQEGISANGGLKGLEELTNYLIAVNGEKKAEQFISS